MTFLENHWVAVYFGVWALCAFVYGLLSDEKDDGKNLPYAGAMMFGLWPIGAVFGVFLSPLWVPVLLANVGGQLREMRERKEAVRKALDYAKLRGDKP